MSNSLGMRPIAVLIDSLSTGLADYILTDYTDPSATPSYHGFEKPDGAWYIKKIDESGNPVTIRFCKGNSAYGTAWTNRASQTYDIPSVIFG